MTNFMDKACEIAEIIESITGNTIYNGDYNYDLSKVYEVLPERRDLIDRIIAGQEDEMPGIIAIMGLTENNDIRLECAEVILERIVDCLTY